MHDLRKVEHAPAAVQERINDSLPEAFKGGTGRPMKAKPQRQVRVSAILEPIASGPRERDVPLIDFDAAGAKAQQVHLFVLLAVPGPAAAPVESGVIGWDFLRRRRGHRPSHGASHRWSR
jgi:hypothetical protein